MGFEEGGFLRAYFVFFLTTVTRGEVSIYLIWDIRERGDENIRVDWGRMEWGGGDERMR